MASDVTVTPDQVSIGVLVSSVPRDVIDAAVAARGVGVKRSGGTLPAHVVVYLTLALCLFPDDDYTEVATKVTGSLSRFGCWDASWRVPTSSGITQARKRVGSAVLADVFEGVAQPVATMSTRGAWLRRWRLLAIDGFDADLSDSDANVAEFGYAGSGDNRSAFPKARVVALAECGTHAFVAAEVDAWSVGEKTLAAKLYPRLRRDELLTADRPRRHPTPRQTPRRVRTHQPLPDTNPASTKERSNKCPAVTLGHQPNVTSPARHPPAHHTTPADATAHQTRHRPAAQHHDQLKLRGIAAGADGVTIEQFEESLKDNLYRLWNRMASGSYFPGPVRAVEIPKK